MRYFYVGHMGTRAVSITRGFFKVVALLFVVLTIAMLIGRHIWVSQDAVVASVSIEYHVISIFTYEQDGVVTIKEVLDGIEDRSDIVIVTNGGIFNSIHETTGLLIKNSKTVRTINTKEGSGNFYLKPNGVFYVEDGKARISSTDDYVKIDASPEVAIQSGPLLVNSGKIHPELSSISTSVYIRNSVSISDDGIVHFVFHRKPCSLYECAKFHSETLKASNALYLDGGISGFKYDEFSANVDHRFASIIVVSKKRIGD